MQITTRYGGLDDVAAIFGWAALIICALGAAVAFGLDFIISRRKGAKW